MDKLEDIDPDILFVTDEERTFQYQDQLPSLPVPDLQKTLDRYLDSGRIMVIHSALGSNFLFTCSRSLEYTRQIS